MACGIEVFLKLLLYQPWLIKKCYWMMWGGDFYYHDRESAAKKKLIRKIRHFVSLVEGDYELAKKWYGANGTFHQSILYTYLCQDEFEPSVSTNRGASVRLLIGNSADPSNNHVEVFNNLLPYLNEISEIVVPLSYGNKAYADEVCKKGVELLGKKFKPLKELISLQAYREILKTIDVAVFNHNRQQGLGNLIVLLAYGKKVFLRSDVTTWDTFQNLGVTIYNVREFNLTHMDNETRQNNIRLMKRYFTQENYKTQLSSLFYLN